MSNFSLTILGSGAAAPALGRHTSCQYLNIHSRHFLIDCGEGAQMQMQLFEVPISKINHIFISHLHGDHYLGLMGLLFSMHLNKRTYDLHLYAPFGLQEIILLQLKYSKSVLNFNIHFHPFEPAEQTVLLADDIVSVETIPLNHKLPCAGFLFREKPRTLNLNKEKLPKGMLLQHIALLKQGLDVVDNIGQVIYKNTDYTLPPKKTRSYAYCSDTMWNEPMAQQIKNVNLLYHESTFLETDLGKATETKHSTAKQAAEMAKLCGAKKLILGHFSARYRDLDELLAEAKVVFENTILVLLTVCVYVRLEHPYRLLYGPASTREKLHASTAI
ncbi:MAG: ribonuclease Z [Flammeovirgaceae bacterium]